MKHLQTWTSSLLLGFTLLASDSQVVQAAPKVDLKVAYPGIKLNRPLALQEPKDDSHRLFVIEQAGRILILPRDRNGSETQLFLDISDRKPYVDNEEGLLGLAFHPQFKNNGKFYIDYVQQNPRRTVISEIQVSKSDPNKADLSSERILLEIPQPYSNHKGGDIHFGPDGFLYISLGDGGAANDPHLNGQNLGALLAKILRIDVNSKTGGLQYGIPKDNPFVGREGAKPEIWAYGLRNVWRMSFDRKTGELWAADVGQDKFEEIDIIARGGNYGWSVREAFHPFKENQTVGPSAPLDPVIEYGHSPALAKDSKFPDHSPGLSITGGYVYRGKKNTGLEGVYVYADFAFGTIWGLRADHGKLTESFSLTKPNPARSISAFGEDNDGEVYVLSFDGKIYEFTEVP